MQRYIPQRLEVCCTWISKKLNFMYGVTGGVTQASHVSVLLSSSLDTCLVTRAVLYSVLLSILWYYLVCLT